jgi:NADPH2:quinone reductase
MSPRTPAAGALTWSTTPSAGLRSTAPSTRCGVSVTSSAHGWGAHALAPLSFRAGTYSGVFTLLPLLTGEGRAHHGEIMAAAARLAEAGKLRPRLDPRRFALSNVAEAHAAIEDRSAQGKIVVDIE